MDEKNMHEQYFAGFRTVYDCKVNETGWRNAVAICSGANKRYTRTRDEAMAALVKVAQERNKGARVERVELGLLAADIVVDAESADDLKVAQVILKRRLVTDWEEVEVGDGV